MTLYNPMTKDQLMMLRAMLDQLPIAGTPLTRPHNEDELPTLQAELAGCRTQAAALNLALSEIQLFIAKIYEMNTPQTVAPKTAAPKTAADLLAVLR